MTKGLEGITLIEDLDLKGKRVFIRLDLNVPLDENGNITDETRINEALPTIKFAMEAGAKVVLGSHMGRPKTPEDKQKLSLEPVATRLSELLDAEVILVEEPASDAPKGLLLGLEKNQIILLENLRFHPDETKNGKELPAKILEYTDVFINDAFGACHRAHATVVGLNGEVKEKAAGFLIKKEVEYLDQVVKKPQTPFVAILGGAKVSDKIGVIESLIDKVDTFVVGGAMAYTFLAADGVPVGSSLVEKGKLNFAKELMGRVKARGKSLLLPLDHVIVPSISAKDQTKVTSGQGIADEWMGVDIGPKTILAYSEAIEKANTVFWNGPMGIFETEEYSKGTFALAKAVADTKGVSIVGGGDSAAAANLSGLAQKMSHISTGGGASLEYLQGDPLPGLEALRAKKKKSIESEIAPLDTQ